MAKTEKLGIHWDENKPRTDAWFVDNISTYYHSLLKYWWDHFGLSGSGLVVGECGAYGDNVKIRFKGSYPGIKKVFTVDFSDADINCDIQKEIPVSEEMDWVICQAVLEHVADPFGAMRNMLGVLKVGGRGFFHIAGVSFKYHPYPVDCVRFYRDAFFEWERMLGNVVIDDFLWIWFHCFVVYRRFDC